MSAVKDDIEKIEENDSDDSDSEKSEVDDDDDNSLPSIKDPLLMLKGTKDKLTKKDRDELQKQIREDKLQRTIFEHILKEETKFQAALIETGKLPYPCECGGLCDYRPIIKRLVNAFNHLYDAYEDLFVDYHVLFVSDSIIPETKQVKIKFSKKLEKAMKPGDSSANNIFEYLRPFLNRARNDRQCNDNYQSATIDENVYEQEFDKEFENVVGQADKASREYIKRLARMQVIHNSRPKIIRLFKWIMDQIAGRKECFCFHCSDRDNLDVYHLAILTLYKEYRDMFIDYLGLYYRGETVERYDSCVIVTPTSAYYQMKEMTETFFKRSLENIVSS